MMQFCVQDTGTGMLGVGMSKGTHCILGNLEDLQGILDSKIPPVFGMRILEVVCNLFTAGISLFLTSVPCAFYKPKGHF